MANDKENANDASQSEEQTHSRFSEQQDAQSSGQAPDSFEEFREKYGSALDDYLDRKFQSFKDTRLGTHETDIEHLKEEQSSIRQTLSEFQELKEEGWTDAQAVRLMEQSKPKTSQSTPESTPEPSEGSEDSRSWREREQAILEDVGIDTNDERFIEFIRETNDMSNEEYIQELETQSRRWRNADLTKPKPSSSTAANTARSESQATRKFDEMSDEEIGAEVEELMPNYSQHAERIKELTAELERRDAD